MSNFTFTGTVQCDRCGEWLSDSDEDCDNCSDKALRRYHFEHFDSDRVETVWAVDADRAWHELAPKVDDMLPWRCIESGASSLDMARMGMDVTEL